MNLSSQRALAAKILKAGENKIRFNPEKLEDVGEALTRDDIRSLIKAGAIYKLPSKGNSRGRVRARNASKKLGRHKGAGKRVGTGGARTPKKTKWINKIRAIRDELKGMREKGEITTKDYRQLYIQAKGNLFSSRRHLHEHIERVKK